MKNTLNRFFEFSKTHSKNSTCIYLAIILEAEFPMLIEKMIRFVEKRDDTLIKTIFLKALRPTRLFFVFHRDICIHLYTNTLKIATTIQQKIMGQLQDHPFPPEG